jgi:prolyl 4-hydroxylase
MCIDNLERLKFAEPMMLYRYVKGQQYKWHFDFVTPSNEQALNEINFFGQRDETKIIYLNEGFEGGETSFKYWEVTAKPKLGKLVQFNNILNGQVDKESVHAGKPVTQGVKWIATLWTREKPYWMRASIWN